METRDYLHCLIFSKPLVFERLKEKPDSSCLKVYHFLMGSSTSSSRVFPLSN